MNSLYPHSLDLSARCMNGCGPNQPESEPQHMSKKHIQSIEDLNLQKVNLTAYCRLLLPRRRVPVI